MNPNLRWIVYIGLGPSAVCFHFFRVVLVILTAPAFLKLFSH